jgi:hypothetical protein
MNPGLAMRMHLTTSKRTCLIMACNICSKKLFIALPCPLPPECLRGMLFSIFERITVICPVIKQRCARPACMTSAARSALVLCVIYVV